MEPAPIERIELSGSVQVSVIIPHFFSSREENLKGLIDDLRQQSFKGIEAIIVRGVSPQGRAINQGVLVARGEILVVMDDDSRMGHSKVIENLVGVIKKDPSVAMAGASILPPPEANAFQKAAARQFPRFQMPIVTAITDSDLPCHGCAAFPKKVFIQMGMERENILRGLDPDLRVRMRSSGYRVVLAPQTWVYHPLPSSVLKFIRVFFRNGYGSAYLQVFHSEINYDTDEALESKNFVAKRSFVYRILRYPLRLLKSLIAFQWIRFLGYVIYVFGYLAGYLRFLCFHRHPAKS